ncbi:MAG: prepilin-type N-terminal cleavage/methylation domain-containing protein [Pseudomonadota bacterium]
MNRMLRKWKERITEMQRRGRSQRGFTIMEIMIVLLIITILATGVTIAVIPALGKAKKRATCVRITQVLTAVEMYYAETGECPSMDELKSEKSLKGDPVDAWDQEFKIECTSDDVIEVVSSGKDKNFGTEDDLNYEQCKNITKKKE